MTTLNKTFILFLLIQQFFMFGQGPDPCPCDPTEGEAAYEACLLLHPECNEEIPVDEYMYVLAGAGMLYASFLARKKSI